MLERRRSSGRPVQADRPNHPLTTALDDGHVAPSDYRVMVDDLTDAVRGT